MSARNFKSRVGGGGKGVEGETVLDDGRGGKALCSSSC